MGTFKTENRTTTIYKKIKSPFCRTLQVKRESMEITNMNDNKRECVLNHPTDEFQQKLKE